MVFERECKKIEINGTEYPYKFDIAVMEKVQEEYGDIVPYEYKIRGLIAVNDENGEIDWKKSRITMPDISAVCKTMQWMIQEGIEIEGSKVKAPTFRQLTRQDEYSIFDLSELVVEEYLLNFQSKKRREKTKKTGSQKTKSSTTTSQ